jgi:HK97 family phage major capsid protein
MTKLQKNHVGLHIEKNSFIDSGDGVVTFKNGLTITDGGEQRNGTQYDIKTMDLSEYKGQVTADHVDKLENIIARVDGLEKKGNKITVKSLIYAVNENPLARLAYNLLVNGFSTDFSIETFGPWPDEDHVYMNAKLIGLSQVVVGNNRSATVNAIVHNSLEQSKEDGLDTTEVEKLLEDESQEEEPQPKNDPAETEEEKATREAEETEAATKKAEEEAEAARLQAEQEAADAKAEEERLAAEKEAKEIEDAAKAEEDRKAEEEAKAAKELSEAEEKQNNKNKEINEMTFVTIKNSRDFPVTVTFKNAAGDDTEAVLEAGKTVDISEDQKEAVEAQLTEATAPAVDNSAEIEKAVNAVKEDFASKFAELQAAFNASAQEPKFVPAGTTEKVENKFADIEYKERHAKQINAAWEYLKLGNITAATTLNQINEVNLDALKAEGKVSNTLSISDFGNFVISPELLTDIQGFRTDFTAIIDATDWRETNSLEFAWMKRSGDIDMQHVDLEPGTDGDGNLKPISEYSAEPIVSKLEELAAVTPVCNSATRFLAVDLLADVAKGYRNDFDRKRAQLVIARMQQAVDNNDANSQDYTIGVNAESLVTWSALWTKVSEVTVNGTFVFNTTTFSTIQQAAVQAGANGPLANIFVTGAVPTIFGRPYVVVPNELMPSLNTGETKTFVVDGESVVINHAVFYLDLSNFTGRMSGGLQYDLSTEASYEVNGVVKSAYQRNELVLRGSFFRGGAILDDARVSGMTSDVASASS